MAEGQYYGNYPAGQTEIKQESSGFLPSDPYAQQHQQQQQHFPPAQQDASGFPQVSTSGGFEPNGHQYPAPPTSAAQYTYPQPQQDVPAWNQTGVSQPADFAQQADDFLNQLQRESMLEQKPAMAPPQEQQFAQQPQQQQFAVDQQYAHLQSQQQQLQQQQQQEHMQQQYPPPPGQEQYPPAQGFLQQHQQQEQQQAQQFGQDQAGHGFSDPSQPTDAPQTAAVDGTAAPKPRRKKWGPPMNLPAEAAAAADEAAATKRKRRSRWETTETTVGALIPKFPKELTLPGGIKVVMPAHLTGEPAHTDPKIKALHDELAVVSRKITNNELDIPPEGQRSPSPEPIYDRNGIRQNTREIRYRDRLVDRKNQLIEDLIKEDPNYKPPADYKPQKKWRKVYIPVKEYPGYNFIGLIIGPRGNTQKQMQKDTNTKIAIRGRGSVKEGASRDPKYDYGEDEELHVLITGDTQEDVDNAAKKIEELLQPMDEARNEHKRKQLRELAALNGTLKDEQMCYLCGDGGHRAYECPKSRAVDVYQLPADIQAKVEEQYRRDVELKFGSEGGGGGKLDDEYQTFLRELGGGPPPELMGEAPTSGGGGGRPGALTDDCKIFVGNLPATFTDAALSDMFKQYGTVLHATILKDPITGLSKCFGFVHFPTPDIAKTAVQDLNGFAVEGKNLVVRLRSDPPGKSGRTEEVAPEAAGKKLFVANLPNSFNDAALRAMFQTYGEVTDTKLVVDHATGQSKGYGFVTMSSPTAVAEAMKGLHGYKIEGKAMTVRMANERGSGSGGGGGGVGGGGGAAGGSGGGGDRVGTLVYPSAVPGAPGYRPPPPSLARPPGVPPASPWPPPGHAPIFLAGAPRPLMPGMPPPAMAPYPMARPLPTYPLPGHPPPARAPYTAPPPHAMAPPPAHHYPPPAGVPPPHAAYPPPYGHPPPVAHYPPPAPAVPMPAAPMAAPPLPAAPMPTAPLPPAPMPAQPPPPAPSPAAPPPPVQSEYERFMAEMQQRPA